MYYLYSIDNNDWFDNFADHSIGYAVLVDMHTGNTVLMTHADADGRLLYIERDNQWELLASVDQVACCYPGVVQQRHPSLNVIGDWVEPTWVTCLYSPNTGARFVELTSDTENARRNE